MRIIGPLLFDGSVDIVAAFRVAHGYYYGGASRCLVQAGAESQSIYIYIDIDKNASDSGLMCLCRRAGDSDVGGDGA